VHSSRIEAVLGYKSTDEVIHRDDLVLLAEAQPSSSSGG
jgi:glutamate 5-kinase